MDNAFSIAKMILGGTGALIAIYLIWKNPQGSATLLSGGSKAFNSGVLSLQGR